MEQVQQPNPQQPKICEQCLAFDAETRELMGKMFSRQESSMIAMMLAGAIQMRDKKLKTTSMSEKGRIMERIGMDMLAVSLGKFMTAFDDIYRKALTKSMREIGITINLKHEACPHQPKAEA